MFQFLCKTLLHSRNGSTVTPHNPSMVVSFSVRYLSCDSDNPHSFTLSYLTKTCGLSPKSALLASKTLQFESSEQPDSVVSSLEKFGFSKIQISEMIKKFPKMLCCHPEKTISPKLEFFRSSGASTPDLVTIFTTYPWIFNISLETKLVGNFSFFVDLLQSEYKAIELIKRNARVLNTSLEVALMPNINTLRENGVPASSILLLIHTSWVSIGTNPVKFGKILEEVKEMGFNPLKSQFVLAIKTLTGLSKSKRDEKVAIYKRWGWSDEDIITAFKKFPSILSISEDKLMAAMDFYVKKLGLHYSVILSCPALLGYSLKKRLIPRGAVIEFLLSKGLVKLDSSITSLFTYSERRFLEKYVKCHEEAPRLIHLYNHKLNLSETRKSREDVE
ncbi:transcription termination factor MTERF15, mitochondrial-like [Euphorbia lathyris]|uniref:transcription termination factor MTERF15, mitochondrial-like n=1 Tax=Euphorbia lathyris TaxID=212925 RepID=UPI003313FE3C